MSETPPVPLPERKRTSSPLHNPPSTKRPKRGPQGVGMGGHVTESDLVVSPLVLLPPIPGILGFATRMGPDLMLRYRFLSLGNE